jgi:hypothetical protein
VVLDPRAQKSIEVLPRYEQVLELVEHDERRLAVTLVESLGQVEQPVDHGFCDLGVRRYRPRSEGHACAGGPDAEAEPPEQSGQVRPDPSIVKRRVTLSDTARHVRHVGHARKIHVDGPPSCRAELRGMCQKHAGLTESTRSDEPDTHAIAGAPAQEGQLLLAVD